MCQFVLAPEPLWAWVCSVSDRQDAIKANELRLVQLTAESGPQPSLS
jgi:hypothetical protein